VLRARDAGNGGRAVDIFTASHGRMTFFVSRSAMNRCGAGGLLPFTLLRFTAAVAQDGAVISQYEGHLLLDMMALSFEEMQAWYYAIEAAQSLFPQQQHDPDAFRALLTGSRRGETKKIKPWTAFTTVLHLLRAAGFEPAADEPAQALGLSAAALHLIRALSDYDWRGPFSETIKASVLCEAAKYIDKFFVYY